MLPVRAPRSITASHFFPGTRRVDPASLVVGHIVGRDLARRAGWSDERINSRENTQPEHARCSSSSGARYGNRLRGVRRRKPRRKLPVPVRPEPLITSREW